jgi:hypothetical protein
MIAAASHWRDWDIALMIGFLAFLMYVPDIIQGVRNYKRCRALAEQITREHDARDFLDEDWQRRMSERDDWK